MRLPRATTRTPSGGRSVLSPHAREQPGTRSRLVRNVDHDHEAGSSSEQLCICQLPHRRCSTSDCGGRRAPWASTSSVISIFRLRPNSGRRLLIPQSSGLGRQQEAPSPAEPITGADSAPPSYVREPRPRPVAPRRLRSAVGAPPCAAPVHSRAPVAALEPTSGGEGTGFPIAAASSSCRSR
jgi:hypothetical protein